MIENCLDIMSDHRPQILLDKSKFWLANVQWLTVTYSPEEYIFLENFLLSMG